jgi:hypothetical protein
MAQKLLHQMPRLHSLSYLLEDQYACLPGEYLNASVRTKDETLSFGYGLQAAIGKPGDVVCHRRIHATCVGETWIRYGNNATVSIFNRV